MISHELAMRSGLHKSPKAGIFKTTDARGTLILQGYKNVPVQISGLPPIITTIYEVIPNGIYSDEQGLTTELFTMAGYAVTIANHEVSLSGSDVLVTDGGVLPIHW